MKHLIKSLALILLIALSVSALAHDKHKQAAAAKSIKGNGKGKVEFIGKGDGVTTCPVTGEKIESKDNRAVLFGRPIYFCCPDCMAEAKKNPAAYVKRTHKEQLVAIKNAPKTEEHHAEHHGDHHLAAQEAAKDAPNADEKFLGKGDGIETCPVTGEPVNKSLKGEANGQTFYVCCEGCIDTVKKNPDAYLKKASRK